MTWPLSCWSRLEDFRRSRAEGCRFAAAFARGSYLLQLAGVFGVYRFVYIMFVQPLADREIWQEYLGYPGGIATAWLFYCLMFLPFLLVYLKCAYHFCREGESV